MASEAFIIVVQQKGVKEAKAEMDGLAEAGGKAAKSTTGLGTAASSSEKHISAIRGSLALMRNALVALSFVRIITGVTDLVDSFINMESKLNLVTKSTTDTGIAMQALLQVANETRAPLDSTVTLFTRLARATAGLKLTNGELLDITRSLNQAFVISGATADETRNAITQLTQGLSLGILRGQDLRSVTEYGSRVAKIFTDEINRQGLARDRNNKLLPGELYSWTQIHKNVLTTKIAVEAFRHAQEPLAAEFTQTSKTIGQGWTQLTNVFTIFFGNLATNSGVVAGITGALDFLAKNIGAVTIAVLGFAAAWASLLIIRTFIGLAGQIVSAFLGIWRALGLVTAGFRILAVTVGTMTGAGLIVAGIAAAIFLVVKVLQAFGVTWDDVWEAAKSTVAGIIAAIQVLGDIFYNIFTGMALVAVRAFNLVSEKFTAFLNFFRTEQKKPFLLVEPEGPKNFGSVSEDFARHFADSKKAVDETIKFINNAVKSGITDDAIAEWKKKLNGLATDAGDAGDEISKKVAGLVNQIESFIARVSPLFDVTSKMDKFKKLVADLTAEKGGAAALKKVFDFSVAAGGPGSIEEVFRRVRREEIGVGNASTDLSERLKLLKGYVDDGTISWEEYSFGVNEVNIKALKAQHDIASGVALAGFEQQQKMMNEASIAAKALGAAYEDINAIHDYTIAQQVLSDELKKHPGEYDAITRAMRENELAMLSKKTDFGSGIRRAEIEAEKRALDDATIAQGAYTDALKQVDAQHTFVVTQRTLNDMLAQGKIGWDQYTESMRAAENTMLQFDKTAESGFRQGILQIKDELTDAASTAKTAFVDAFHDMQDALVDFLDTGHFSLQKFAGDLTHNLNKLAVQQVFGPAIGQLLGIGAPNTPGSSAGGGLFGLLGPLFGATGLGGPGAAPKGTLTDPLHVILAGGAGGLGGLASLLPSGGGNPGSAIFQNGNWIPGAEGFPEKIGEAITTSGTNLTGGIEQSLTGATGGGGFLSSLGNLFSQGVSGIGNLLGSIGSGIGGLFGGGGGGGGIGSFLGGALSLIGLAGGGDFDVGGAGATDSQIVAFRASPDEHVSVTTPGQQARENKAQTNTPIQFTMHVHGVSDANSFARAEDQIYASAMQRLSRASRRNN